MSVPALMREGESNLKKTYSVKLMGVKDGEIGVSSKRVMMSNI